MPDASSLSRLPRPPFQLASWRQPFLPALLDALLLASPQARHDGDLSRCAVIFPHRRPRRYLQALLAADPRIPKPCRPPFMLSSAELTGRLRVELVTQGLLAPAASLGRLDQVELLRLVLLDAQRQGVHALEKLPLEDLRVFFPWGLRLASLLEECLTQNLRPGNVPFPEEQAPPFAAALLEELGLIYELYLERLDANGWTTPGRDAALIAERGLPAALALERREELDYFLAGFARLNGAEDALYRGLWERGALSVLWHADPRLALGPEAQPHWSCEELRRWLRRWGAGIDLILDAPAPESGTRIALVEGFDLHSQLDALSRLLAAQAKERGLADTALVLPATELLLPALHHLPHARMPEGVNVSMGYPLNRSALAQLVELLLRLQENAPQRGLYHWRDCVDLIRLPYLKMLSPIQESDEAGESGVQNLRTLCHELENHCRKAGKYLDPRAWRPEGEEAPQERFALLSLLLERCLSAWESLPDLGGLADALEGVCDALLRYGAALWPRFPLDSECLHRLLYSVIPSLRQSLLSRTPLPQDALFAILRGLLEEERAPFEAEPLGGLQLLGLLETRLLSFERLYILDATDSKLPGGGGRDPLLPDSLRPALGLPDERVRERVAAYVFHRLLQGAREATILYQSSSQGVGLLEEKSVRSRYVEELLWEEEKRRGALIAPGDPLVRQVSYPIKPIPRSCRVIAKTPETRALLQARLLAPISPSALDCHLRCPARFFYEHVAKLKPLDECVEEGDPAAVGALLHDILKEYFNEYLNRPISKEKLDKAKLQQLFSARLASSELFDQLPYDQRLLLEKTGRRRLAQLIEATPETTILDLEAPCQALASADLGPDKGGVIQITLNGRLDRIDLRPDGPWILDYKTGGVKKTALGFWEDAAIWSALPAWGELDEEEAEALQTRVAQLLNSAQLPCYLHLYHARVGQAYARQACYVALREEGKETPLFPDKLDQDQRSELVERRIPALLGFLVGRMAGSSRFAPNPDQHCDYCPYRNACEE